MRLGATVASLCLASLLPLQAPEPAQELAQKIQDLNPTVLYVDQSADPPQQLFVFEDMQYELPTSDQLYHVKGVEEFVVFDGKSLKEGLLGEWKLTPEELTAVQNADTVMRFVSGYRQMTPEDVFLAVERIHDGGIASIKNTVIDWSADGIVDQYCETDIGAVGTNITCTPVLVEGDEEAQWADQLRSFSDRLSQYEEVKVADPSPQDYATITGQLLNELSVGSIHVLNMGRESPVTMYVYENDEFRFPRDQTPYSTRGVKFDTDDKPLLGISESLEITGSGIDVFVGESETNGNVLSVKSRWETNEGYIQRYDIDDGANGILDRWCQESTIAGLPPVVCGTMDEAWGMGVDLYRLLRDVVPILINSIDPR